MECFDKGIIGLEQTGGIDLRFGNTQGMIQVLEQIVTNSGALGPVLSQGSASAARVWGSEAEDCLITVKNQEAPAHMPQAKKSLSVILQTPGRSPVQRHDPMYEDGAPTYLERLLILD
jgi:aldehyde:ferredoxin oxidoreductase